MPKTPKEMERIIMADGWRQDPQNGSHRHYKHPIKKGKVTIPFHSKELSRKLEHRIYAQAELNKNRRK